ncbi:unnamed protein product [Parnassius apollo]|uniref:(apollo) hypothetical protein n=1 Tax=Parnassius apollo TaxID=110799 RepID=A0A8S3Y7L0_PARAO|nr:unnamed protein product [Parnassius apollo]
MKIIFVLLVVFVAANAYSLSHKTVLGDEDIGPNVIINRQMSNQVECITSDDCADTCRLLSPRAKAALCYSRQCWCGSFDI